APGRGPGGGPVPRLSGAALGGADGDPRDRQTARAVPTDGRPLAAAVRAVWDFRALGSPALRAAIPDLRGRPPTHRDGGERPTPGSGRPGETVEPGEAQTVPGPGRSRAHAFAGIAPDRHEARRAQLHEPARRADPEGSHHDDSGRI